MGWREEAFLPQKENNSSPGLMAPCGLSLKAGGMRDISSEMCQSGACVFQGGGAVLVLW